MSILGNRSPEEQQQTKQEVKPKSKSKSKKREEIENKPVTEKPSVNKTEEPKKFLSFDVHPSPKVRK